MMDEQKLSLRAIVVGQLYDEATSILEAAAKDPDALTVWRAVEVGQATTSFSFALEQLANAIGEYRATRKQLADG